MAKYSEAHKRATEKWRSANRYRCTVMFDIADKDIIHQRAGDFGSVNAYIISLVKADLKKWGGNNG